jgi:transcriptional regulator with XRE-family HTH domain
MQEKNPKKWKSANKPQPARKADTNDESTVEAATDPLCARLHRLRKQKGWTLEQLAAASGVSRSMLSQIERNRANPTLAVAFRIARAFGLSMGSLLDEPQAAATIDVIRSADKDYHYRSDKDCRIRTLSPLHLEKDVEFYEVSLAAGAALRSAPHYRGTREFLTVKAGQVVVASAADRCELGSGDSAHYPADVPHTIENAGAGEAVLFLVVIYRPGG